MTTAPSFTLDRRARLHLGPHGGLLVGGTPVRVLRLGAQAARRVAAWTAGEPPTGAAELRLARRLHDDGAGLLRSPGSAVAADVHVVVPVRDRPDALRRCLTALAGLPVLVVDDASRDAAAVAGVARDAGARLLRLETNVGPGGARNAGLAAVVTPLVAFVDSDCVVPLGWLDALLPALLDARVAVVAPRVVGAGGPGLLARYEVRSGPLDLGPAPAPVRPGSRVGHLPAAVLLARREALGDGFDPALRLGEDVDLVWRLAARGLGVRYEPGVHVRHETRSGLGAWLRQRHGYGRSAADLDRRHPGAVAPVAVSRWSLPAVAATAAGRPELLLVTTALTAAGLLHRLPDGPGRGQESARLAVEGLAATALGLAEAAARPWLPAVLLAALVDRRVRRLGAAAVAVRLVRAASAGAPSVGWGAWAALRVLDDLAYASGVWRGAVEGRRAGVLLPRVL